jgi:hypothetical protein
MFEISHSDWYREYDSINPNRKTHGLYGFIVRANEFHKRSDGTDDPKIKGRYYSGNYNILGLIGINKLNTDAIIQGTDGTNGFEFVRYGPGRALKSISRSTTTNATIVQGVASGEDTALATMWVILGQSNYGIAVPAWVKVRDIPKCLANGDMFDRAKSLYNKGDEAITQASVFPVEAHIFKMVNNRLLPHWRTSGVPSVAEMSRVEHQIANDAFSLLDCLDNTQRDNKAPGVTLIASPNGFTINFGAIVKDSDGTIKGIEWNFGDEITSAKPSPSHTYAEAGTYLVSVTVTDDDGVSITDWNYFTVPDYSGSNQQRPSDDAWNQACDISDPNGDIIDYKDMAVFTANWLVGVE